MKTEKQKERDRVRKEAERNRKQSERNRMREGGIERERDTERDFLPQY